jgi:hypothetical protein
MRFSLIVVAWALQAADYDVTRFGARADGKTDNSTAIQSAIAAAAKAGGGRVILPPSTLPYLVRSTIAVHASAIEISGAGAKLMLADNVIQGEVMPLLLFEGKADALLQGVALRGLKVDSNYFNQAGKMRSKAVVFKFVEGAQIEDVEIDRAYVGLSIRRSVNVEARRVTVRDYQEDAFDAGGDADEVPGGTARGIRFIEVVAKDAPRGAKDGNAFEIEDGATDVLIQDSIVENVSGNGAGLRNHNSEGNHSANVELRNVLFRKIGGEFAVFGRSAGTDTNSYRGIRLIGVTASDSAVAMAGPITGLEIRSSRIGALYMGFRSTLEKAIDANALADTKLVDITVDELRINPASKRIVISGSSGR